MPRPLRYWGYFPSLENYTGPNLENLSEKEKLHLLIFCVNLLPREDVEAPEPPSRLACCTNIVVDFDNNKTKQLIKAIADNL